MKFEVISESRVIRARDSYLSGPFPYSSLVYKVTQLIINSLLTARGPVPDNLGEMISYVKSQGIEHNPTASYSPQSNGVAKRMNRTLFEMACTMLDASGAPLEL